MKVIVTRRLSLNHESYGDCGESVTENSGSEIVVTKDRNPEKELSENILNFSDSRASSLKIGVL